MTVAVNTHKPARRIESDAPGIRNRYGQFSPDGREYIITDYKTPRPWVNLIANPRVGLAVSQTGSGFSWIDNSQLAVINRWQQEFAQDAFGKFLYVRDAKSGELWSLSPAPTFAALDHYECRHGIGYSTFVTEREGIRATWTLFCDATETVEYWIVRFENKSDRMRRLEVTAFLEWCMGTTPSSRREFHKLFIETQYSPEQRAVFASNHMWDVPDPQYGHWNTRFPYVSALACTEPVLAAQGDMAAFIGRYGHFRAPEALASGTWKPRFGRHEDPIAAIRSIIELRAGQSIEFGYVLATGNSRPQTDALVERHARVEVMSAALAEVQRLWARRLESHRVETPEPTVDYLTNDWLRYQAIAGRIWGRAGYYQQSGAYGFRDQLQDSQIWLTIDPAECRKQIALHAAHQFADGSVYHWWHPLSEMGHVTKMTDDLLWLSFVTANYLRETGDFAVLSDRTPFLDDTAPAPLIEHIWRAFQRVFERMSPRGLPYIGAGDWNDGLSACGLQERGESIWLGHFLVGLLADWAEVFRRIQSGDVRIDSAPNGRLSASALAGAAADFDSRRIALIAAINHHAWDGEWYMRATLDSGEKLGSRENRVGRIFLNAQTWAVLNDVAPPDRAAACMNAVKQHLVSDGGALLLAPAYDEPVSEVGYITRYAPGLRENGGVYMHAATWAIAAAAKMRDPHLVERLLTGVNPALKDPDQYWAEPYVTPGNVDGPSSPYPGRGGWTWYTGSAAWLSRIITHYVLGVRPEFDGLRVDPCLPASWRSARMTRPYRGCTYRFEFERVGKAGADERLEITVNGARTTSNLLPHPERPGQTFDVYVRIMGE